jgi:hypothetical protein
VDEPGGRWGAALTSPFFQAAAVVFTETAADFRETFFSPDPVLDAGIEMLASPTAVTVESFFGLVFREPLPLVSR